MGYTLKCDRGPDDLIIQAFHVPFFANDDVMKLYGDNRIFLKGDPVPVHTWWRNYKDDMVIIRIDPVTYDEKYLLIQDGKIFDVVSDIHSIPFSFFSSSSLFTDRSGLPLQAIDSQMQLIHFKSDYIALKKAEKGKDKDPYRLILDHIRKWYVPITSKDKTFEKFGMYLDLLGRSLLEDDPELGRMIQRFNAFIRIHPVDMEKYCLAMEISEQDRNVIDAILESIRTGKKKIKYICEARNEDFKKCKKGCMQGMYCSRKKMDVV